MQNMIGGRPPREGLPQPTSDADRKAQIMVLTALQKKTGGNPQAVVTIAKQKFNKNWIETMAGFLE